MSGYCRVCGETVCICADPDIDSQSSCEMWKSAFKTADEKWTECSNKLARLTYLVNMTYWIDDNNQLHQVLMDGVLADLARDILENEI